MNERILKLFTQACYHADYEPENVTNEVVEKFAESIVRECVDKMESEDSFYGRWMGRVIKEHFGVEE